MQTELRPGDYKDVACDLLAFPVFEEETADSPSLEALDKIARGVLKSVLLSREFKPELHQTCRIFGPPGLKSRYLLLLGAGKQSEFTPARLRQIAGTAVRAARSVAAKTVAFLCRGHHPAGIASRVAAEGAIYANFESDIYKTRDRETRDVEKLWLLFESKTIPREAEEGIRRGTVIGDATNFARTLGNEPSNILTPAKFADRALEAAGQAGLIARIMERDEMETLGMHTLLAVGRGSEEPPKLILLQTKNAAVKRHGRKPLQAFVGKGVTFDSGGISLKPSDKMEEMKNDMAGGAAVLSAMVALAKLGTEHSIIGLIPAVENLPSGKAVKPGDVVKSYLGKTVEIINTDAEGRLILADALAYARNLGANRIIDIATLTGSIAVALGHINAGIMGTDQKTIDRLRSNCAVTGEGLWQLPLDDEYRKAIRSEIADIKNSGERWGGAITAAKFLQEFTEDTPWVHLDIAGVDLDHDGRPFACKGATGFGVRTLVQLMEPVASSR
jgi:leucyl aminopeptidase